MTVCTPSSDLFPSCKSRKLEVRFDGGDVTSDAGILLLRQADRRLGLLKRAAQLVPDHRRQASCDHRMLDLIRQRVYGLALGYEDVNDHQTLRADPAFQTGVDRVEPLASSSTLCRFENGADREAAAALNGLLVETFIRSFKKPPEELVLDFDATDDPVHGQQEGRFFHGYYDQYCFLPLYVFCGDQLLVSYLRPSNIDAARHAWAILKLLVTRLRQAWPGVRIIFRADSGFCRWRMMRWMDRMKIGYIMGLARNDRITALVQPRLVQAARTHARTGKKVRRFTSVKYAALTWDRLRRVIAKIEHGALGSNPRFVVTNLKGDPQKLYDDVYCARGECENRIKEQLQLFSDRTSCHRWWANQFRLLLSSLAYALTETIRRVGLRATELARAHVHQIRLKLFKIGAVIVRTTRRIRFHLSNAYPHRELFMSVAHRLARL